MNERVEEFLDALEIVCLQHGIALSGRVTLKEYSDQEIERFRQQIKVDLEPGETP